MLRSLRSFILAIIALPALVFVILRFFVWRGGRRIPELDPQTLIRPLPVDVEAIRLDPHQIKLRWTQPAAAVTAFGGPHPDKIDFTAPLGRLAGGSELVVPNRDKQRPYFALKFDQDSNSLLVAERFLPLKKGANARDIGGYRTANGRRVAWGKVFRAGDLSRLTNSDLDYLAQTGLRWICDLRSTQELKERPDRRPAGVDYFHLPVNEGGSPIRDYLPRVLFQRAQLFDLMQEIYLNMVSRRALLFGRWLALLADPANLPVIVHCTAGKDRTGLAIALLLGLLGVPEETILGDYTLTNLEFDRLYRGFELGGNQLKHLGVPLSDLRMMLVAHPDWLAAALSYIKDHYGDIPTYLISEGGLTGEQLDQIRENLLC